MNKKIHILIVDDHQIVRDGLRSMLMDEQHIIIIGEAANGKEALAFLEKQHASVDLVMMDINMPVQDGLTTTEILNNNYPDVKVLVLTMLDEKEHIAAMIDKGANGYILKNSGKDELVNAIGLIAAGQNYFGEDVKNAYFSSMVKSKISQTQLDIINSLTDRELEILRLIANEHTNIEIGEMLFISSRTVDAHRRNLLEKTGCRNTAGLISFGYKNKLFD